MPAKRRQNARFFLGFTAETDRCEEGSIDPLRNPA
jgi:hypothetical protein